jgi:4-alpha-glucanotransferase
MRPRSEVRSPRSTTWPRSAGILLHPTSLPGPHGIGDLGPGALGWLEFLADSETGLWQILPLGPTGFGDSPYQSFSSFAGNPLLISPHELVADGLLATSHEEAAPDEPSDLVDFAATGIAKARMLRDAYSRFSTGHAQDLRPDFDRFTAEHEAWLAPFALFMALKDAHGGLAWTDWPEELRDRDRSALKQAEGRLADEVGFHRFVQFLFSRQWEKLRNVARDCGVTIIGDLPIYVAEDSVDVWLAPHLFRLDAAGRPTAIAGVPSDSFSETGQLWGSPLYDWEAHRAEGYAWWIERFRATASQLDIVRVDHFRAFADYWEVPAGAETAETGRWRNGPGAELFDAVTATLGSLPLIAEDLGDLSPQVPELRDKVGLPGMKVLQDAFQGDETHDFLPHRYPVHCVAYTGNHDNHTSVGWYEQATEAQLAFARRYLKWDGRDPAWRLIRASWESAAMFAVAPLQDFLRLGDDARMNTPATTTGNWQWRATAEAIAPELAAEIRRLNRETGRAMASAESRTEIRESR